MPAQQQPPPSDQTRQRAAELAVALGATAALGAAAGAAGGAVGAAAALLAAAAVTPARLRRVTSLMLSWGWDRRTIRWGIRLTIRTVRTWDPPAGADALTDAQEAAAAAERTFAAWFIERSAERVQEALDALPADVTPAEADAAAAAATAAEERFVNQHLDAQERRRKAAEQVDEVAAEPGQLQVTPVPTGPVNADGGTPGDPDGVLALRSRTVLAWHAHPDDRVTPECRAADGAWFYADTPPVIGYPGMPHGGTCRCWPTKATARQAAGRSVNEAVAGLLEPAHRTHPGAEPGDDDQQQERAS